jgi:hypothetical protein
VAAAHVQMRPARGTAASTSGNGHERQRIATWNRVAPAQPGVGVEHPLGGRRLHHSAHAARPGRRRCRAGSRPRPPAGGRSGRPGRPARGPRRSPSGSGRGRDRPPRRDGWPARRSGPRFAAQPVQRGQQVLALAGSRPRPVRWPWPGTQPGHEPGPGAPAGPTAAARVTPTGPQAAERMMRSAPMPAFSATSSTTTPTAGHRWTCLVGSTWSRTRPGVPQASRPGAVNSRRTSSRSMRARGHPRQEHAPRRGQPADAGRPAWAPRGR